jgi:hypothetical protein
MVIGASGGGDEGSWWEAMAVKIERLGMEDVGGSLAKKKGKHRAVFFFRISRSLLLN